MKNRIFLKVALIVVTALALGFISLPDQTQKSIFPATPDAITSSKYHLGLDLQGGSQLDYKIDLRKVPSKDQQAIIDGVLGVINNRVNGLGVSEPNIYISTEAGEKHLIVELAGIKDLEEAKRVVGKTIQLEFKEKNAQTNDAANKDSALKGATAFLDKVKIGGNFAALGTSEQELNPDKVSYSEVDFQFKDQLPGSLVDTLTKLNPGEVSEKAVEVSGEYSIGSTGNLIPSVGYNVVKVLEKRDQEREPEKFEDLAKTYSDDTSNKNSGGVLTTPVDGSGTYVKEFETAALALKKEGDISGIIKTAFGFHILKADKITPAADGKKASVSVSHILVAYKGAQRADAQITRNEADAQKRAEEVVGKLQKRVEQQIKYEQIFFNGSADEWKSTGLTGQQFVHADVQFDQTYRPFIAIEFNDEGAKLFEDITGRNIGKPLAMFVGGKLVGNPPTVNQKISGGKAQITGTFTIEEATTIARDLNTGAIPAPITLTGQYTIGATLGQDALNKSLWAGIIGFVLVAIFMIAYYRLPGLLAVLALGVYSILILFLIKVALPLEWALPISLAIFIYIVVKILNSRDSGPEKTISLILACFILFFITFVLSNPVVMTLAGIAGVILSIGMAVDANILIFERVKEELRDGRPLSTAIDVGFDRAWSSIRDSNFSSLITCGILFYFGSSIIQGFAFNLAMGILVSMFTAVTITKTLITALTRTRLANNLWLFGAPKKKDKKMLPVIQTRKISYVVSGLLLVIALLGIPVFGLKLGLDFTGGTLMDLKFAKQVSMDDISKALEESAQTINVDIDKGKIKVAAENQDTSTSPTVTPSTMTSTELKRVEGKIDLGKPHIVPSENGYIIKTRHVSSNAHDLILQELKTRLGDFEELRFTTVGPTVGESLRWRAILAVFVASIMIVLYIAFAFRKIPKHIGQWKFGTAAVIALLHDLGIMLGIYVYLGIIFGVEIDALFITALLTVLGFSVHDTIVVFDRIREKLKYQKRDETFLDVTNQAINETIGRSINTSLAVLLTLIALAVFGSESIRFFVISLIIGIVAGTYSSIFIASPILVDWYQYEQQQKSIGKKKPGKK